MKKILALLLALALVLSFAAGIVAHTLANIFDRQRSLTLSNIIAAVVSVGFIALTVIL